MTIHFIMNVKVFFATYWTLTMDSGALWSRSCYPPLSVMKLPGQTIFPMIYWRHPLLEWRMAFLYQITGFIWWVFHTIPLFPPYWTIFLKWRTRVSRSEIHSDFTKFSGTVGSLRAMTCSSMYFPYGKFTASAEHPVSLRALECCLAPKTRYKTENTQCIFLCLQAPARCIAQPPIWKSWIHLHIMTMQFSCNESRTQQPQKASRIL